MEDRKYVAIVNVPGYLPDAEPFTFDSAREAWEHLLNERNLYEDEWFDPDVDAPKYSVTSDALHTMYERAAWERMAVEDWDGTGIVTGNDVVRPETGWVYEVRLAEEDGR